MQKPIARLAIGGLINGHAAHTQPQSKDTASVPTPGDKGSPWLTTLPCKLKSVTPTMNITMGLVTFTPRQASAGPLP